MPETLKESWCCHKFWNYYWEEVCSAFFQRSSINSHQIKITVKKQVNLTWHSEAGFGSNSIWKVIDVILQP